MIEFERPVAVHWSYQLGNYWSQTIDWANFTSSTNSHQARVDLDGWFRLVVARVDPGVPNWLDTAGHREGVILYRYHKPESKPVPTTKLVKLAELRGYLPAETPVVSIVERAAQVERRRAHQRRRWQPRIPGTGSTPPSRMVQTAALLVQKWSIRGFSKTQLEVPIREHAKQADPAKCLFAQDLRMSDCG